MEIFLLIIRLFLAAIFALAGIGKLYDTEGSEKAVKNFGVPESLAKPFAILLPLAEILVAILLLFAEISWFGAIGAFIILLIFIGGMLNQMRLGNAPDCHCFGQIHSAPVSKKTLLRNAVFVIPALILILSGRENQGIGVLHSSVNNSEFDFMNLILGVIIIGFLAAIVYFLKQISDQQTQILRRIEVLEILSHEGSRSVERENISSPEDGLPIGAPAPNFELPNVYGKNIHFEHLLAKGKPLLLFFVGVGCVPCASLLPEIEKWQKDLGEKLNFVFVSNGAAKENLAKFSGASVKEILIQKENEVAKEFNAVWTPTALLINSDGTIGSRPAVGDGAIRKLIEKIEKEDFESAPVYIANGNTGKLNEIIPDFSLESIDGKTISAKDIRGRKTIIAFWGMNCPFCLNMIEDLRDWDKQKGQDEPNLILLSSGEADEHKILDLDSPVLLDNDKKVAENLGMSGTPSAILVDGNGKIISETAVGADQIWSLLGKKGGTPSS